MSAQVLEVVLAAGFLVVLSAGVILDEVGDFLFRKGVAKPFYLRGHRLHHRSVLLALVPTTYAILATLVSLHYLRVLWYSLWPSVEFTLFLAAACVMIDLTLDAAVNRDLRGTVFHHEWVYFLVPAYLFTHLLVLA